MITFLLVLLIIISLLIFELKLLKLILEEKNKQIITLKKEIFGAKLRNI
jgi:hypothetical protein